MTIPMYPKKKNSSFLQTSLLPFPFCSKLFKSIISIQSMPYSNVPHFSCLPKYVSQSPHPPPPSLGLSLFLSFSLYLLFLLAFFFFFFFFSGYYIHPYIHNIWYIFPFFFFFFFCFLLLFTAFCSFFFYYKSHFGPPPSCVWGVMCCIDSFLLCAFIWHIPRACPLPFPPSPPILRFSRFN